MAKIIEIQITPTWVYYGDDRACYIIERVDVDKYLCGKTFRKIVDDIPYVVRFEKEHISIRKDVTFLCDFSLKISIGKKQQKERMQKGLKILSEFSKELQEVVAEQQKERDEWLSQDTVVFSL